jgi:hypothetical protein
LAKRISNFGNLKKTADSQNEPFADVSVEDVLPTEMPDAVAFEFGEKPLFQNFIPNLKAEKSFEGRRVVLRIAVFVDRPLVEILEAELPALIDRTNMILTAFNAVDQLFADPTLGPHRGKRTLRPYRGKRTLGPHRGKRTLGRFEVKVKVAEIIFDAEGRAFAGNGEAKEFLQDFCRNPRNSRPKNLLGLDDGWTISAALTGTDIFGLLDDVRRDAVYSRLNFRIFNRRVYAVKGGKFSPEHTTTPV